MDEPIPSVICIMGPTASGKTDLALALARHFPVEIINVDSAQVYQKMDIGAGKVEKTLRDQVPHHLIDFIDPKLAYSAAQFREDALTAIQSILNRQQIPLLVGGTMLYFKVLQQGLSPLPNSCPLTRQRLTRQIEEEGLVALYANLEKIDPITAKRLQPTDRQRIQRALEIYQMTGQPMSYWLAQPYLNKCLTYQFINIGLMPIHSSRSLLYERIRIRFENMLAQGLVAEVASLLNYLSFDRSLPAIRAVGYRQVSHYLFGECSYDEMQEKAIAATRQLAKRQLTWLRHWPDLIQFDCFDEKLLEKILILGSSSWKMNPR